jgi:hypothetical protein
VGRNIQTHYGQILALLNVPELDVEIRDNSDQNLHLLQGSLQKYWRQRRALKNNALIGKHC